MYPNLETHSESDGEYRGNSFFEQNCNQIFMKGPALTKEILVKVNAEIVPKKTYLFGREFNTKRILLTAGLCLLFSTSFFGALLTWFTNTLDNYVLSQMVLKNNSDAFTMWQKPTARAVYNIYVFNYTNIEEYKNGYTTKFKVQELGPYSYEETLERIDISFPTEDTITYRERRTLNFMPRLSKGRESDMIIVPNLPVIGGSAATKSRGYFAQLAYNAILTGLGEEAFLKLSAGSFTTGYKDKLYEMARTFLPSGTPNMMGLLVGKMGESPTRITINTGKLDINKYGLVEKVDGESQFDFFSGNACNSIESTDGAINPPKLVQNKKPLHFLFPQACRRMPLVFEKETTILNGKVPAYQYVVPEDIFDSVDENPDNGCYCNMESGQCPLKGIFNVTKCNFDAPMFLSLPHFHRADPVLLKHFSGLNPDGKDYKTYFKIHPTMGFAMAARNILQVNIQVQKAQSVSKMSMFEDGQILPIAVIEGVLDEKTLPQNLIDTIYLCSFTVPSIELALKYGSLLTSIITLACLILVLKRKTQDSQRVRPERLVRSEPGYYVPS